MNLIVVLALFALISIGTCRGKFVCAIAIYTRTLNVSVLRKKYAIYCCCCFPFILLI